MSTIAKTCTPFKGLVPQEINGEIEMAPISGPFPVESDDDETLWTKNISDCCCIATYDHASGLRTLVHLRGSVASDGYYQVLVSTISPSTTIIIGKGTAGSTSYFRDITAEGIKEEIVDAMKGKGKKTGRLNFIKFATDWEDREEVEGAAEGSFGITSMGQYGIMDETPQTPVDDEDEDEGEDDDEEEEIEEPASKKGSSKAVPKGKWKGQA